MTKECEKDDPVAYWKWRAEKLLEKIEQLKVELANCRTQCELYKYREEK